MRLAFTEYVRCLEPESRQPPPEVFEAMWQKLHDVLAHELRKRGLLNAPPSCLGFSGWRSWSEPGALDELLHDSYLFAFLHRLPGLQAALEMQGNVEGLIFRNVRNFLYDRQRKHDPLGSRVYDVLRDAARRSVDAGSLVVIEGDARMAGDTVLSAGPMPRGTLAGEDLELRVRAWADELLPELVTGRGQARQDVVEALRRKFADLAAWQPSASFHFRAVAGPLKREVRSRWSAIWSRSDGEVAWEDGDAEISQMVRWVRPDSGYEERQAFEQLIGCVAEGLARLEVPARTRSYAEKLWLYLRSYATGHFSTEPASDGLPSRRKLADLLDVPRQRFPDLYSILRQQVETCRPAGAAETRGETPVSAAPRADVDSPS